MRYRLGRRARVRYPWVPHASALMAGVPLPPIPPEVHYAQQLPENLPAFWNDQIGDCTIAGMYAAREVWRFNADGVLPGDPENDALATYEQFCDYIPSDPSTDQGGVEQDVLGLWVKRGIPSATGTDYLSAFVEIDPRQLDDVRRSIAECGLVYIGFNVPSDLPEDAGSDWNNCSGNIEGGHCVVLTGYAAEFEVLSWGNKYTMSEAFFGKYVDEVYGLIDADWIAKTGKTPFGMTLAALTAQMQALG